MRAGPKKQKWTYAKLGGFLAEELSRLVFSSSEAKDLLRSSFPAADERTLLREWIFFNLFMMFQGVSAYFKGSQEGFRILDHFHHSCSRVFAKSAQSEGQQAFMDSLMSRYEAYSAALKRTEGAGPLRWLSKEFCRRCGDDRDPITVHAFARYWVHATVANKRLIGDVLKGVELAP